MITFRSRRKVEAGQRVGGTKSVMQVRNRDSPVGSAAKSSVEKVVAEATLRQSGASRLVPTVNKRRAARGTRTGMWMRYRRPHPAAHTSSMAEGGDEPNDRREGLRRGSTQNQGLWEHSITGIEHIKPTRG